jgi:hypothetical protein
VSAGSGAVSLRLSSQLLSAVDAYAQEKGITRSDAIRDLLTAALIHAQTDLYAAPLADMVSRIMRAELVGFRQAQEAAADVDRDLIQDKYSDFVAGMDSILLFLISTIKRDGAEGKELYDLFRAAGYYSAVYGYDYNTAIAAASSSTQDIAGQHSDDDAEAW